ncbi:TIGR03557 family F420-dependent LLM class oxidoreductase [Natronomonas halophila]|uniref:TIGR03557 family F420-dependent LLM class oxidoreductase n=1 Tax=Natronomonas halophila TaxID=2747817 RepID=UPI0015B44FFA|nr:TIGR03557 family F420-dependent LLM class oxidoreductase [Natronomonas halophila]QLD87172.1 TIGR03557 family F420-dependent LLM class oxidoreductase [Natronomonas halophila]
MRTGLFTAHEQHAPTTLLDHATAAEDAGFDSIWTSDHFHPWWHTDAHCGAAWPWLGAALERTDDIRFGTGVTPPIGRYHPGLIAQAFATLGAMYPGRPFVTLATGEAMNEKPLGYEWPEYPERKARLEDACEIITRLWDGGYHDYDGHYWTLDDARLYTLPDERVPLYVAGNGPNTAEVAGKYADGFLTLADIDTYEDELVPALERGAETAGRDPEDIDRIRQFLVSYGDDEDACREAAAFWRGTMAVDFSEGVADPREIERQGREVPLSEMDEWGLITTDIDDVLAVRERHKEAGFDEIEFLSSSPDQGAFIETLGEYL